MFCTVADVITAVLQLMDEPTAPGRVFNIGSDHPVSILNLGRASARHRQSRCQDRISIVYRQAYDEDFEDIRRRVPDLTRLRSTIDYRPKHTLQSIIRDVHQSKLKQMI